MAGMTLGAGAATRLFLPGRPPAEGSPLSPGFPWASNDGSPKTPLPLNAAALLSNASGTLKTAMADEALAGATDTPAAAGMSNRYGATSPHSHPSPLSSRRYPPPSYGGQKDPSGRLLDDDNEEHLSDLHGKVASLKAITIDIGNEVREQNQFLDSMVCIRGASPSHLA